MKKLLLEAILLALVVVPPVPARADVNVQISVPIPLPPAIVFPVPPALVVIPETYVYAAPDIQEDIFFYEGWWWRPWNGRWYRSRNYNAGWAYYRNAPSFYAKIPSSWRNDYRDHHWKGHPWNYQRIPQQRLQSNWREWESRKHWESQDYWGVRSLRSRPPSPDMHSLSGPEPSRSGHAGHESREGLVYRESERPQFRETGSRGSPAGRSAEKHDRRDKGND
jgi:hypothetical protein